MKILQQNRFSYFFVKSDRFLPLTMSPLRLGPLGTAPCYEAGLLHGKMETFLASRHSMSPASCRSYRNCATLSVTKEKKRKFPIKQ